MPADSCPTPAAKPKAATCRRCGYALRATPGGIVPSAGQRRHRSPDREGRGRAEREPLGGTMPADAPPRPPPVHALLRCVAAALRCGVRAVGAELLDGLHRRPPGARCARFDMGIRSPRRAMARTYGNHSALRVAR